MDDVSKKFVKRLVVAATIGAVALYTLNHFYPPRDLAQKAREAEGPDSALQAFCAEMESMGEECIVADSSFSKYWDQESVPCTIGWTDSEGNLRCVESWSPLEIPWLEK